MPPASLASNAVKQPPAKIRGKAIMFLLRAAFWLSIVVILLPTPASEKQAADKIGTTQAITAASAAVSDMGQFCARQPEACTVGAQALTQFGHKAQASAKWLYEFLSVKLGPDASVEARKTPAAADPSQHTLTPADATPAWRGPQPQRQAAKNLL
jgi:uncharacterized protein DUF5330